MADVERYWFTRKWGISMWMVWLLASGVAGAVCAAAGIALVELTRWVTT